MLELHQLQLQECGRKSRNCLRNRTKPKRLLKIAKIELIVWIFTLLIDGFLNPETIAR